MKRDKGAAVGLVICFVAMIAIVGAITFKNYERKSEEELARTEEEQQNKLAELEDEEEDEPSQITQGDNIQAEIEDIVTPEPDILDTPIVSKPKALTFPEDNVMTWPIDGNVILSYSMDETIYFPTLEQYKYNSALVIAGEVGEEVLAADDGEVTSITQDSQTGLTVRMNLGDGYEAIYGQLKDVTVSEGERVLEGEFIGNLSEPTKYYSVEGCNLYFQLLKDGSPVNPLEYLDV